MDKKLKAMEVMKMNVLILLLGGNPLPNYVTARYLLMKDREKTEVLSVPEKIIMVSTPRTETYYNSIIQVLEDDLGKDSCSHEEIKLKYEKSELQRDPAFIRESIMKTLERIHNKNLIQSVHLGYTGGTKPMSVNGFISVEEFSKSNGVEFILSDLDPDDFKLKVSLVSSNHQVDWFPQEKDLRDFVKLDIKGILKLHNLEFKKADNGLIFKEGEIDEEMFGIGLAEKYRVSESKKRIQEILNNFKDFFVNTGSSQRLFNEFPFLPVIKEIKENHEDKKSKLYKFLQGKWLEDYVFKILTELKNSGKININEMKKGIYAHYKKREQELDLIVLKGYQLFLISCTTSQKITVVKPKLFEALYRAEQLGGEQAKVIMVSTMFNQYQGTKDTEKSNIEELDKELEQFEARKNCILIGLDELTGKKSLPDLLENFIEYGGKQ